MFLRLVQERVRCDIVSYIFTNYEFIRIYELRMVVLFVWHKIEKAQTVSRSFVAFLFYAVMGKEVIRNARGES